MTKINLNKIKQTHPKTQGYFIFNNVLLILGLSLLLIIEIFLFAIFIRNLSEFLLFPTVQIFLNIFQLSFLLIIIILLAYLSAKLYHLRDWNFSSHIGLIVSFLIISSIILGGLWYFFEEQIEDDNFKPTQRGQNYLRKLNIQENSGLILVRGKIKNIDFNNKSITVKTLDSNETVVFFKDEFPKFFVNQSIVIVYEKIDGKNIVYDYNLPRMNRNNRLNILEKM